MTTNNKGTISQVIGAVVDVRFEVSPQLELLLWSQLME